MPINHLLPPQTHSCRLPAVKIMSFLFKCSVNQRAPSPEKQARLRFPSGKQPHLLSLLAVPWSSRLTELVVRAPGPPLEVLSQQDRAQEPHAEAPEVLRVQHPLENRCVTRSYFCLLGKCHLRII